MDDDMLEENNDNIYDIVEEQVLEDLDEEEDKFLTPAEINNLDVQETLVIDNITTDRVTLFEYTEIVGIRAEAISRFNNCMVDISGLTDPIKMAEREFNMRKCPLLIQREVGTKLVNGRVHKVITYLDPNKAIHPARSHVEGGF